jgi:CHAT domain-containing protein/TPR repeat protein
MNEQNRKSWFNLLYKLQNSSFEEALEILKASQNSIDDEALRNQLKIILLIVAIQAREDIQKAANSLQTFIDNLQRQFEVPEENYILDIRIFISELIIKILKTDSDPQEVYPLLKNNLEKLDDNFHQVLWSYASETLPAARQGIAVAINDFSTLISDFPLISRHRSLEIAITGYEICQTVFNHEEHPERWAMVQINLGNAYLNRVLGKESENLEKAISYFKDALQFCHTKDLTELYAATQFNLGIAYSESNKPKLSIASYRQALRIYKKEKFPELWAKIHNNIGLVYSGLIGANQTKKIRRAIFHYLKCLSVCSNEIFPELWALIQKNLGIAYWKLGELRFAVSHYEQALKVYSLESFPEEYAKTLFYVGLICQSDGRFHDAYNTFASAIETVETLRKQIISSNEAKVKLAEEWNNLYQRMVAVCIELASKEPQYYAKAIEYVERSKVQILVELIARSDIHPNGKFDQEVLNKLKQLEREIQAEWRQLDIKQSHRSISSVYLDNSRRHNSGFSLKKNLPDRTRLNDLQKELANLINYQIYPVDPSFSLSREFKPIYFKDIQALLDEHTAIIEWYVFGDTFFAFVISRHSQHPRFWKSSPENLEELIKWAFEYLEAYTQKKQQWINSLAPRLSRLAEILHLEDILKLVPDTCLRLILIPHRFLHLFPIHALPLAKGDLLCDRFPNGVGYAPSCQLLQLTQKQKRPDFSNFFAIQNPTDDLLYTNLEVEIISSFFPSAQVLVKQQATKIALNASQNLPLAHCNHFSCHGEFNLTSPLESALILANEEHLTLGEIFGLTLNQCRLVTLSACETGLTDPTSISDEYIGLPSGFLYAGSPSVVSSLWTVSDLSTAFLMIKFYENFQSSQKQAGDVAIALNQAQQWLRNLSLEKFEQELIRLKPQLERVLAQLRPGQRLIFQESLKQIRQRQPLPFANPYYWAAFTATGL